jgi:hypothetical protein
VNVATAVSWSHRIRSLNRPACSPVQASGALEPVVTTAPWTSWSSTNSSAWIGVSRGPAASKGQLVCVLTSRQSADDQGIRQKVVLMKVDSVGADGALNLTLTAWNVPR